MKFAAASLASCAASVHAAHDDQQILPGKMRAACSLNV